MKRSIATVLLFMGALISVCALALPPQWGPEHGNRPADVYANGKDYFLGQAVVQFNHVLPDLYNRDGKPVVTGDKELDALCAKYQVYFLRDLVPWEKAPVNGNIDCRWIFWLQFDPTKSLDEFLVEARRMSCTVTADPNYIRSLDFVPNDPSLSNEWHIFTTHAEQAWDYTGGDSTIIISICDSGLDMTHPDLIPNLWVNPGEDLNHDGIIEADEINNTDNDGNNLRDDFYGWNWTDGNNNPQDNTYWSADGGHGTHVAGCADARTNNGIGVASPARIARLMIHRIAPSDNDPTHISSAFGVQAWSYSRSKSANIINNSWGGGGFASGEQNVLTSCYNAGMLIFCAAGNNGDSTHAVAIAPHYPAAYANVISVAASTASDTRASFSCYGTWIKITAPGEQIYSTIYDVNSHYDFADGTSMASPVAAGCAALLWSVMPGADRATVRDVLYATATPIQVSRYGDSLGAGRIDVGKAVASQFPGDSLVSFAIRDTINGTVNGRAEPGDTVAFAVTVANTVGHAGAVFSYIKIIPNDPGLVALHDSVFWGSRSVGTNASTNQLKFYVPGGTPAHRIQLTIRVGGMNSSYGVQYHKDFTQTMMLGFGGVLIVDDDGGDAFETFYQSALDSINEAWDTWTVTTQGAPDTTTLAHYSDIFWFTGNQMTNVLSEADQNDITWIQQHNKRLLFSSQGAGGEIGSTSFHQTWLHASWSGTVSDRRLLGIANNILGQNMNLYLNGANGGGAQNTQAANVLTPTNGSITAWNYNITGSSGIVYTLSNTGNVNFIYCGFPVESINANGIYSPRTDFFRRVLDVFRGTAVTEPVAGALPKSYALSTPYPNPFNPSTTIHFALPNAGLVKLTVFDVTGRTVATLLDGHRQAGNYSITWNAASNASGLYFIRMEAGNRVFTQKALLTK